jgi:hypothetical protein
MPKVAFKMHPDGDDIGLAFPPTISEDGLMKAVIRNFGLQEVTSVLHFYDTKGATIDMLSIANLSDGDTILVFVPESTSEDPYKGMSRTEKRDAISGKPFEGIEVTMAPESIRSQLNMLQQVANNKLATTYPATTSLNIVNENWGTDMSVFPPLPTGYPNKRTFRPSGDAATWDLRLRSTLAILSECTPGQAEYIGSVLNAAVELRSIDKRVKRDKHIMTNNDVVGVIKDLVHPLEGKKKDSLDTRKRKTEYDSHRKTESKNKKDAEQALDADMPVGGKGMQVVEKNMKKSMMKENEVDESDSEDEDMEEADGTRMAWTGEGGTDRVGLLYFSALSGSSSGCSGELRCSWLIYGIVV